jgi:hypothetical protein
MTSDDDDLYYAFYKVVRNIIRERGTIVIKDAWADYAINTIALYKIAKVTNAVDPKHQLKLKRNKIELK